MSEQNIVEFMKQKYDEFIDEVVDEIDDFRGPISDYLHNTSKCDFYLYDGYIWPFEIAPKEADRFPGFMTYSNSKKDGPYFLTKWNCFEEAFLEYMISFIKSDIESYECFGKEYREGMSVRCGHAVNNMIRELCRMHKDDQIYIDEESGKWCMR